MADSGNASPDPNITVLSADRTEQLEIYDSLPRRWRRLIDDLPVPQDLHEVAAVMEKFGESAGYKLIVDIYQQQYPGWRPTTGQDSSK